MNRDEDLLREGQRIEALIAALESQDDPRVRRDAKELLQVIMGLHAEGLARLMEIITAQGEAGRAIVHALTLDQRVAALLLLHGLHPLSVEERLAQAMDKLRPQLAAQGFKMELVIAAEEEARLELVGNFNGKRLDVTALRQEIERSIFDLAPEVQRVVIDGLPEADSGVREMAFVPVSSIGRRVAAAS